MSMRRGVGRVAGTAVAQTPRAAPVFRRGAAPAGAPVTARAAIDPSPGAPSRGLSPPAAVSGMTRSEIFAAKTPELTNRLQQEIVSLGRRVSEDAPQYLHSLRQVDDMVSEVLARWRRSTTLALNSISSLEEEISRKGEAIKELHTKLADKDAALASSESEMEAVRIYAQRLELHLGRILEAAAGGATDAFGVSASSKGSSSGGGASDNANSSPLPAPLMAALRGLLAATTGSNGDSPLAAGVVGGGVASTPRASNAEVDTLRTALKEGSHSVLQFFADLDATYPAVVPASARKVMPANGAAPSSSASAAAAVGSPPMSPAGASADAASTAAVAAGAASTPAGAGEPGESGPSDAKSPLALQHEQALRNIDATLRRALAFAGKSPIQQQQHHHHASGTTTSSSRSRSPRTSSSSLSPRGILSSSAQAGGAGAAVGSASGSPRRSASNSSSSGAAAGTAQTTRVASLEIEFDPLLHSRATVGQLKAAVAAKAGRKPLSIAIAGRPLTEDAAKLVDVGVPLKAAIEVVFESVNVNNNSNGQIGDAHLRHTISSAAKTVQAVQPPALPQPHVPRPAAPLSMPSKLSPPLQKRPLASPIPHRAPQGLSNRGSVMTYAVPGFDDVHTDEGDEHAVAAGSSVVLDAAPAGRAAPASADTAVEVVPLEGDAASSEIIIISSSDNNAAAVEASGGHDSDADGAGEHARAEPRLALPAPRQPPSSSTSSSSSSSSDVHAESVRILSLSRGEGGRATGSIFHMSMAHPSQRGQREALCR